MKHKVILVLVLVIFVSSCLPRKKIDNNKVLPKCIANSIDRLQQEAVQNPQAQVWKWETDRGVYYYFNAPCCDRMSRLVDTHCLQICAPDGGFTGRGDGKCPEFNNVKKTLIWKDERK